MKARTFNVILVLVFSFFLSSCMLNYDENSESGCTTMDQVFSVDKLSDLTVSGVTINNRIEICSTNVSGVPAGCMGVSSWVYSKVQEVLSNSGAKIWKSIAEDSEYQNFLASCVVLVILFYGLMVMMGMVQVTGYSAFMVFLKISLVYMFATKYDIFEAYVINTFEALVNDTTKAASRVFLPSATSNSNDQTFAVLEQIDLMISYVWDPKIMKVVMAMITAGATGIFWALAVFSMTVMYLLGVLNALKVFIIALIGRYVLYALGPIFLVFALFNQTRSLFESWVEQIMSFALQPVFLFVFLSIFHVMLAGIMINLHLSSVSTVVSTSDIYTSAVCWRDVPGTGNEQKAKTLVFGNCKVSTANYALCQPSLGAARKPCECDSTAFDQFQETKGLSGKFDISFVGLLSVIIISFMLMPMANWVVSLAASLSGGLVSAASASVPGMNRIQSEVGRGMGKILDKGTK